MKNELHNLCRLSARISQTPVSMGKVLYFKSVVEVCTNLINSALSA